MHNLYKNPLQFVGDFLVGRYGFGKKNITTP